MMSYHYELRVFVRWPDVAGNWQTACIYPDMDRDADRQNYFSVTEAPDIVFSGGGTHPGFVFDSERVENRLAPYVGENSYGEAIFGAINESKDRHGCFWVDKRESEARPSRAVCVEWELMKVSTLASLAPRPPASATGALRGYSAEPLPPVSPPAPQNAPSTSVSGTPPRYTKRLQDNQRWRITRRASDPGPAVVAVVESELLADAIIALLQDCQLVVYRDKYVYGVKGPACLHEFIRVVMLDTHPQPQLLGPYVYATSENGDALTGIAALLTIEQPIGADDVDRLADEFRRQQQR